MPSLTQRRLRKTMKKVGYKSNYTKVRATADRALKLASQNVTIEHKTFTLASTAMTAAKVPTVDYLQPAIASGESCVIKRIIANIIVKQNTSSALIDNYRVDLVLDRTPAQLTLNLLNLYNSATPKITAPINFNTRDRYKIVRSYSGSFNDTSGTTSRHIHINYRSGLKTVANSASMDQDKIEKNAYYLVFWTDATSNTPIIQLDGYVITNA